MPALSALPGFRVLPQDERGRLDAAVRDIDVQRGQVLFAEREQADSLWAVHEGKVHIVKSGAEGREVVLEVVAPGELFGAVVAIEGRPYPATAIAAEDGKVWKLPASVAQDLCRRFPTLRNALMGHIAERLRSAHDRLRSVALERVEQRLARALLALATKIGVDKDGGRTLSVTRQELADMTGTTVESAIRVLSRWQGEGWIGSARQQVVLQDTEELRRIADGR